MMHEVKIGSPLSTALELAKIGKMVFPCHERDFTFQKDGRVISIKRKSPRVRKGFHEATGDEARIREWWSKWPSALVGLPTGAANGVLVVDLDVDATKGKNGLAEWERLRAGRDMDPTFTVKTQRGGMHIYFRNVPGIRCGSDVLAPGIDIRSDGGYVIFPTAGSGYEVACSSPVCEAPGWLLELLHQKNQKTAPVQWDGNMSDRSCRETSEADINEALRHVSPDVGYSDWIAIGQALHSWDDSSRGLYVWDSWSRLGSKYDNTCAKHWQSFKPGAIGLGTLFHYAKGGGWAPARRSLTKADKGCPMPKEDLHSRVGDMAVVEVEDGAALDLPPPMSAAYLFENKIPRPESIIEGFLEKGTNLDIGGPSKARKSFLSLQMAVCIGAGLDFLGFGAGVPRRVLYLNAEVPPHHMQTRFLKICDSLGVDLEQVRNKVEIVNMRGHDCYYMWAVRKYVEDLVPDIVFVDPFYSFIVGDESKPETIKPLLRELDSICKDSGAAIAKILHFSKGYASDKLTIDRTVGSGVIGRHFDSALFLSPHADGDDLAVLEVICRNYAPRAPRSVIFDDEKLIYQSTDIAPALRTRQSVITAKKATSEAPNIGKLLAKPLPISVLISELQAGGMSLHSSRAYIDKLLHEGNVHEYRRRSENNRRYIGFLKDIENMKKEGFKVVEN